MRTKLIQTCIFMRVFRRRRYLFLVTGGDDGGKQLQPLPQKDFWKLIFHTETISNPDFKQKNEIKNDKILFLISGHF